MARQSDSSGAYLGMLVLACVSMCIGIGCLVIEATEYDWANKPAGTVPDPKASLPKPPVAALPADGPAVAAEPPTTDPVKPEEKPTVAAKPAPKSEPTAKTEEAPKPLPKSATPAAAPEEKKPDGPTPSPIRLPRR